ncbi:unnamed protein product [Bemisia tabaci]|uniref:Uncharacterized protein n=1 Tax=Bemisia tabaci TaxID=7038 RepID=A0A9P0AHK9_BEMTA|nr:unnamed protein product [Bemisia tabaci]
MEEGITLLKECRGQFHLKSEDNDLLFPVPFTGGAYDGSIIFSEFVRKGKLQKPQLLNCRSLRRHIATASQLQRYDATATKNLATFMGHTGNIHDVHYRRPLAHFHRIQIGARLLSFRKPASKPTEEVSNKPENVDSIPHTATSTTPVSCNSSIDLPTEDLNAGNLPQSNTESIEECANKVFDEENEAQSEFQVSPREEQMESSQSDNGQEANKQKRLRVLSEEYDSQSSDGSEFEAPQKKKMKKARWSDEDKNLIFLHFGEQIKAGINPPRHKVKKVYENNPSLRSRQLNAVVTYIYCLAGKNKRK